MEEKVRQAQRQLFEIATLLETLLRQRNEYKFGVEHPTNPEIDKLIDNLLTKKKPLAEARGKVLTQIHNVI